MRRRLVPAVVLATAVGALLVPLACSEDASTPSRDDGPATSVTEPDSVVPDTGSMIPSLPGDEPAAGSSDPMGTGGVEVGAIAADEVDCDAFAALGQPTNAEALRGAAAAVSNLEAQAVLNSLAGEAERVQAAHPGEDIFTLTSRSADDPPLPADIEAFQTRLFTELFPLGAQLQTICVPGS